MRPDYVYHKCRPSLRQSHHISPRKSPTSSFRSSTLTRKVGTPLTPTSRCAIAPLSAATGYLPAVIISSGMSCSLQVDNTTYSYPMLFDPHLRPPGFNLPITSAYAPAGHQPISSQGSLCTNSGVDSPTWKHFTCPIWTGMLGSSTSHLVCSGSSAHSLPFGSST